MNNTPPQTKGYPNIVKFNWSIYSSSTHWDFQKSAEEHFNKLDLSIKMLSTVQYIYFILCPANKKAEQVCWCFSDFLGCFNIFLPKCVHFIFQITYIEHK